MGRLRAVSLGCMLAACTRREAPIVAVDAETTLDAAASIDAAAQHTLVLPYGAFGPQAECHELVGFEWYSWEQPGSFELEDTMQIAIVVYRGIARAEASRLFPSRRGPPRDPHAVEYRYVGYDEALAYLDRELADEDVIAIPSLHRTLADTRAAITRTLGGV